MKSSFLPMARCRLCGHSSLEEIIDFGVQAVANRFHSEHLKS